MNLYLTLPLLLSAHFLLMNPFSLKMHQLTVTTTIDDSLPRRISTSQPVISPSDHQLASTRVRPQVASTYRSLRRRKRFVAETWIAGKSLAKALTKMFTIHKEEKSRACLYTGIVRLFMALLGTLLVIMLPAFLGFSIGAHWYGVRPPKIAYRNVTRKIGFPVLVSPADHKATHL